MNATRTDRVANLVSRGIPLLIALSYGALALSRDLRLSPLLPILPGLVVLALGLALVAARARAPRWSPALVLGLAVAFRLLFLFRPPELSDDIFRYLWDGGATLSGHNPYLLAPAHAPASMPAEQALQAKVNHPELVTIYPPAAQLLFAAGRALGCAAPGGGVLGLKLLLVACDLAACLVIRRLLRGAGLPEWRLALYAWHPLPVLEVAGSGHIDGAAVLFLLVAVLLLVRSTQAGARRAGLAAASGGACLALSVLTKLFPLVFAPALLFLAGRRRSAAFLAGAVLVATLLVLPFLPGIVNMLGTLSTYARNWEFAGLAFRTLRRATGSGDLTRLVLGAAFLAACAVAYGARGDRSSLQPVLGRAYAVALAFLLLTPTLHPWYALYVAALLPFAAGPFGLALSGTVFLGYRILARYATDGTWIDSDLTAAVIVAVPLAAYLITALRARRSVPGPGPRPRPESASPPTP